MFEAGFTYILSKSLMNTRTKKTVRTFARAVFSLQDLNLRRFRRSENVPAAHF